ncbi:endolytic transglycosylase MltG [Klenkia brasiliensis]|uniref:endolytic transglycosylase MltG n=1 Tax=Klenkia brasiliensis TaxID=333142 RepID=UPI001F6211F3|nr:endolytic transglycosylase MltG [Klenkia brasiliensis]
MGDDRSGRRARHDGEGRPASDILREWHTGEFPAISDEPTGPLTGGRRARRRAMEEEAARRAAAAAPAPEDDATVRTPLVPGAPGAPVSRGPAPRPPVSALSGLVLGSTGEHPAVRADDDTDRHARPPVAGEHPATRQQHAVAADQRRAEQHEHDDLHDDLQDDRHDDDLHGHPHEDHPAEHHHDVHGADHADEHADDHRDARPVTGEHPVWDQTGGLEVIGADDDDHHGRRARRERGRARGPRRKRRPVTIVLSLLVLAGLVVGIVFGGQWLYQKINPVAADYNGSGSGEVDVRVESGDSLTAIARTLTDADVIASTGPFVDAASANPAAANIQPGVYSMALQMSGQAALDRLLDPAARLFSRVTLPEGLRVDAALQRIADNSEIPLADLQAAAADPAALGLPSWANGLLEGHLFPATYDIEPGQTAVDVLTAIVARGEQTYESLGIPEADRLRVLTEASLVQAEAATTEDMSRVATVINNRIAIGMPLQFDTTVNYATGKTGITTTADDRATDSPYNTYRYPGLPPGAIDSPGEEALQAVLNPTPGDWLYFVVVNPDTGDTRFAATAEEHAANVALFQQWLRENPGG